MEKKPTIKSEWYTWRKEDFPEYLRLVGLAHDGFKNGKF